ncbi:hypothetical protein [Methanobacterium petrolearium]|uniref:hypothetical protein n=1 Tax=Methanobacterium petrolearium TaxID=710190 RepID=UPI001AE7564D|nr:hypothetical protein [Methanobacterium petrolearium]MBP1945702.1 hypothetical protein [Methanobacterium petrolearium]BDZ71948.1 hypothetical protein GCM10025861_24650 [Methanobacterium petrolearium]
MGVNHHIKACYNGKCANEECKKEFKEDFIIYKCEECNEYFCYACFCKQHYERHKKPIQWLEYRIKNGKPQITRDPHDPP